MNVRLNYNETKKGHMNVGMMLYISDIDECAELPNVCKGGECRNTFGSFTCTCATGYVLDETKQSCVGNHCYDVFVFNKFRRGNFIGKLNLLFYYLSMLLCKWLY